ncbi:MAG: T9SS type A sorting domain-containing protein [Flavobacteriaceae bacterium]
MIAKLLPMVLLFCAITSTAQQKLKFTYDTAGNQIVRERVCITCLKAVLPVVADSLATESVEPEIVLSKNFGVIVYPNPVTNLLFAEWQPNASRLPEQFLLFSMNGRLLSKYLPTKGSVEVVIDTTPYPPGLYILEAVFTNGEQRSFKVMKE